MSLVSWPFDSSNVIFSFCTLVLWIYCSYVIFNTTFSDLIFVLSYMVHLHNYSEVWTPLDFEFFCDYFQLAFTLNPLYSCLTFRTRDVFSNVYFFIFLRIFEFHVFMNVQLLLYEDLIRQLFHFDFVPVTFVCSSRHHHSLNLHHTDIFDLKKIKCIIL